MLGSNVSTVGGFPTAFLVADEWGCECIQIYLTLSRRWGITKLPQEIITEFKNYWQDSLVQEVVSHIPFLVNLASPDKELWKRSVKRVCIELNRAEKLGVSFVVIHLGSSCDTSRSRGVSRVIKALNIIFQKVKSFSGYLLIETMAGQGNMIGSSFNEIADILNRVDNSEKMGVCFDTAHVFQSGYDLRGYVGYRRVMQQFDKIIGVDRIKTIHLNDSKSNFSSQLDRHAAIGKGRIGMQMFHAIMNDQRFFNIPKIIEVPKRDTESEDSLKLLRDLQHTSESIKEEKRYLGQTTLEDVVIWKKRKKSC